MADDDQMLMRWIREARDRLMQAETLLSSRKVPLSRAQTVLAGFELATCHQCADACIQKLPKVQIDER